MKPVSLVIMEPGVTKFRCSWSSLTITRGGTWDANRISTMIKFYSILFYFITIRRQQLQFSSKTTWVEAMLPQSDKNNTSNPGVFYWRIRSGFGANWVRQPATLLRTITTADCMNNYYPKARKLVEYHFHNGIDLFVIQIHETLNKIH